MTAKVDTGTNPVRVYVGVKIPARCSDCGAPLDEHCTPCGGCFDPSSPDACSGDCT